MKIHYYYVIRMLDLDERAANLQTPTLYALDYGTDVAMP